MSKHTPGPWIAEKLADRAAYNIFTPGSCSALLTLEPGLHDGADPRCANVDSNARLIAAAPELLEAVRQCLTLIDKPATGEERAPTAGHHSARLAARAAIAKATGGQQ